MLLGIIPDEQSIKSNCEKTCIGQKGFVYLQGKYEKHICIVIINKTKKLNYVKSKIKQSGS